MKLAVTAAFHPAQSTASNLPEALNGDQIVWETRISSPSYLKRYSVEEETWAR
jgi:hypothetical protein